MRKTLAYVKKLICSLRQKIKRINSSNNADEEYPCVLNVVDIKDAETIIIKLHQRRYFKDEVSNFIRMRNIEKVSLENSSKITSLDLFIDENELLISLISNQNFKGHFIKRMKTAYHTFVKMMGLIGYVEEKSSFRKPPEKSLEGPDKISTCDTISITKGTRYKFQRRITDHTTVRSWISCKFEIFSFGNLECYCDIWNEVLLSPINLLPMNANVILLSPSDFKEHDSTLDAICRRWNRIHLIVEVF